MLPFLLPALLLLAPQEPAPKPAAAPVKPLTFHSQRVPFKWDVLLPLTTDVDGLKVNSIFFNKRAFRSGPFKNTEFGTRAQVEVTNSSPTPKTPKFAVAVFDGEDRLIGVATGGVKFGSLASGTTETFDLSFSNVQERLPLGAHFYLSVELVP